MALKALDRRDDRRRYRRPQGFERPLLGAVRCCLGNSWLRPGSSVRLQKPEFRPEAFPSFRTLPDERLRFRPSADFHFQIRGSDLEFGPGEAVFRGGGWKKSLANMALEMTTGLLLCNAAHRSSQANSRPTPRTGGHLRVSPFRSSAGSGPCIDRRMETRVKKCRRSRRSEWGSLRCTRLFFPWQETDRILAGAAQSADESGYG